MASVKTERLVVRLDADLARWLRQRAKKARQPLARVVRDLLDTGRNKEESTMMAFEQQWEIDFGNWEMALGSLERILTEERDHTSQQLGDIELQLSQIREPFLSKYNAQLAPGQRLEPKPARQTDLWKRLNRAYELYRAGHERWIERHGKAPEVAKPASIGAGKA
jgi:hypothetical protein